MKAQGLSFVELFSYQASPEQKQSAFYINLDEFGPILTLPLTARCWRLVNKSFD